MYRNGSCGQGYQRSQPATINEVFRHVLFEKETAHSATRFVVNVVRFDDNNTPYVTIVRQFYKSDTDEWLPTKRNIFLPVEAWRALTGTDGLNEQIEQAVLNGHGANGGHAGPRDVFAGAHVASGAGRAATSGTGRHVSASNGNADSNNNDEQRFDDATCSKTETPKYSSDVTHTAKGAVADFSDGAPNYQPKRRKH
jgi:hypothetical protein